MDKETKTQMILDVLFILSSVQETLVQELEKENLFTPKVEKELNEPSEIIESVQEILEHLTFIEEKVECLVLDKALSVANAIASYKNIFKGP